MALSVVSRFIFGSLFPARRRARSSRSLSAVPGGVAITVGARDNKRSFDGPLRMIGLSIESSCGAPLI